MAVNAKSNAKEFYKKLGFVTLEVKKAMLKSKLTSMFMVIQTIEKAV